MNFFLICVKKSLMCIVDSSLFKITKENEAVSKVTDTVSFFTYTKQSSDFPKPELCHVPDFLYLWT